MSGHLHLLKLCVGADTLDDQIRSVAFRSRNGGQPFHTTRMVPKRVAELLDGGSLYWVIKGYVQGRQPLSDIVPVTGADGIRRCRLIFEPRIIATTWQPRRPFQGWRYLEQKDAPRDLEAGEQAMDPDLGRALAELGLL